MAHAGSSRTIIKVLVVGESGAGKSSLVKRAIMNTFKEAHEPTIGVDFHLKTMEVDGKTISLQLWDIAGHDSFGSIYRVYYKDAFGALVVFDQGSQESFDRVLRWKSELDGKVTLPDESPLPTLLVANKDDLEEKAVDKDILDGFSREHEFSGWIATSAKTNYNVDAALRQLVSHILKHETAMEMQENAQRSNAQSGRVDVTHGRGAATAEEKGCC